MSETFDPAAPVSCRYGAPMGRCNSGGEFDPLRPLHLVRLRLDSGGYDAGGVYWGHGAPLYAVHDAGGDFYETLRARSRDDAKAKFRKDWPGAWFHGERNPVRCYDNGGASADRYTVVYLDQPETRFRDVFAAVGMSADPFHPLGIGQHCTAMDGPHLGKRIPFDQLPADCQKLVYQDRTA